MCEQGEPFNVGELRNNNQQAGVLTDEDANANDIRTEDAGRTGETGTLSGLMTETTAQDKVIIWGTDSQCDDPELAEFEMLECQELEAYLVEEGEDFVGLTDRKELQEWSASCSKPTADQAVDNTELRKTILHGSSEQESSASHMPDNRKVSMTELGSETDIFVSCSSTISCMATAKDTVGGTQTADSLHIASGPYSTISEDLTLTSQTCNTISERGKTSQQANHPSLPSEKSAIHQKDVDMNLNSTVHSEDVGSQSKVSNAIDTCINGIDEHRKINNQRNKAGITEHKVLPTAKKSHEESNMKMDKSTQADEPPDVKCSLPKVVTSQSSAQSLDIKKQPSFDDTLKKQNSFDKTFKKQPSFDNTLKKQLSFDNILKKQASFENTVNSNSSNLERRKPWGSPSRPATPSSPKTTSCSPKRQPGSPAKVQGTRALSLERSNSPQRDLCQVVKPLGKTSLSSGIPKPVMPQQKESEPRRSSPPHKSKNVRPKIITYIRKNPQARPQDTDAPQEASNHPLSSYSSPPAHKESKAGPQTKSTPVLCSSNLLFDKYRQEMQKVGYHPPVTGVKSSTIPQRLSGKSDGFHEEVPEKCSVYRSPRALRPQLGLGAVTRQPAAKTRIQQAGPRSTPAPMFPITVGQRSASETTPKSVLLKSGQSGLRPPGFSALPAARLAAFGFVRSSSVSSVSSNQSNEGSHSDSCRPSKCESRSPHILYELFKIFEKLHIFRTQLCVFVLSNTLFIFLPSAFTVHVKTAGVQGVFRSGKAQELDQVLIQQLQARCEQQALQLQSLQAQLKKASLCLEVFGITTQHFCCKVVNALNLNLMKTTSLHCVPAFSVAHWEQLQQEKEELERRFKAELQGLQAQQQRELGALEERLKAQHMVDTESLRAQQRAKLEELQVKQQEQVREIAENHEMSLMEMETAHNDTLATLQEEHARTVKSKHLLVDNMKLCDKLQQLTISVCYQDQVDTLTFQNRSLRDRAKRFEEALRKSTDEQIDALAPYKHIEEDLKSLKEVLEMKNQQIHQQELKISELEKIAEKNVYLEERLQVLQQQNEDLKERIDKNLAVSRQLSEENANLQVHVEKESNEKKRLSRTNEELLWRLQTGELSPRMSPSSSPIHRPSSGPGSPARPHSYHQ
uniref:Microtubule associated tumor suppressor candidate 2a n=1 Tax=Mastacembelus armatus TaxID=205130 RepID=A0A3Q3M3A8_9TELE